MSLTEVELKAVKILVEERLRRSCNEIKDLKGLCKIHDKIEVAQLQFEQIPFLDTY